MAHFALPVVAASVLYLGMSSAAVLGIEPKAPAAGAKVAVTPDPNLKQTTPMPVKVPPGGRGNVPDATPDGVLPAVVPHAVVPPARMGAIPDSTFKKVTLTSKAAERLGIEIDEVRIDPAGRKIVPYSAVFYDLKGNTWVYVSIDPLAFVRAAVRIETIKNENVYLSDGPSPGTKVLAAGVPQVFGAEVGVGH